MAEDTETTSFKVKTRKKADPAPPDPPPIDDPDPDDPKSPSVWNHRYKLAWVAMFAMVFDKAAVFFIMSPDRLDKMGNLSTWFYMSMASIVGAYMGMKTWSTIKGK